MLVLRRWILLLYNSTCINLRGKILPAKHFQVSVFSGFMSWLHLYSWLSNQNHAEHFYFNWNWTKYSFHCFKDEFLFPKALWTFFLSQLFPSWSLNESWWYDAFFPNGLFLFRCSNCNVWTQLAVVRSLCVSAWRVWRFEFYFRMITEADLCFLLWGVFYIYFAFYSLKISCDFPSVS